MGFASHALEQTEQEDTEIQAGMRTKTSFIMITVLTNSNNQLITAKSNYTIINKFIYIHTVI